jgi:WhiB family redox-sensing transcriptional regulator
MTNTLEFPSLGAPILEERPWAVYSACRGADAELFFAKTRSDERAALAICSTCPVTEECLVFALETRERFGVWGGTHERDRRKLLRA